MIEQIITATIANEFTSIAWASQVGWLVKPWTKKVEIGEKSSGQFKEYIIPAAHYVKEENCEMANASLFYVMPDQNINGMVLIKQLGDASISPAENIPRGRAVNIDADIEIAVWMNDHQGSTHIAKGELWKLFSRKVYRNISVPWFQGDTSDPSYDMHINKLKVLITGDVNGNPFSDYSFGSDEAIIEHKFSAFGITLKLTGLIFPGCFPSYPELDHGCQPAVNYVIDEGNEVVWDGGNKVVHT